MEHYSRHPLRQIAGAGRLHQIVLPDSLANNKRGCIHAFNALWSLHSRSFHLLNNAHLVLRKKKQDAREVKDYRPIGLVHGFNKIFVKTLSRRVAPHLPDVVLPNQSALIKGRQIHDNFMAVRSTAKLLHAQTHNYFAKGQYRQSVRHSELAISLRIAAALGFLHTLDQLDFHPALDGKY